jgi:hypothetical protein
MDTKSKLLTIKEVCSKALSMTIKESYLSNLYILQKEFPSCASQFRQLATIIMNKCNDNCTEEDATPEVLSQDFLGYDLFGDLDRLQIYEITYVFTQKIINDIFNDFINTDREIFDKTSFLRELVDDAFATNKDAKSKLKNKRYYSKLFREFLDNRKKWYNSINAEIDLIVSKIS